MFTMDQKRTLLRRLKDCLLAGGILHIVTHADPDQDGAAAAFLIMNKLHLPPNSNHVAFHFLPQGQRLSREEYSAKFHLEATDLVIHVDTGGKLDVDELVFDHHFPDCEYHSATDILCELLYVNERHGPSKYIRELTAFVNRIDSGHEVGDIAPSVYADIDVLNQLLYESHGPIGKFTPNLPGPQWFMVLVKHKPEGTTDYWHLAMMVYALASEAQRAKDYYAMETRFAQEIEPQLEIKDVNGLRVAFSATNPFSPSDLRDAMNRRHSHDTDLVVYENTGKPEMRGRFTVVILSRKGKNVAGMFNLAADLRLLAPQANVFLHQAEFLIYVREVGGVKLPFNFKDLKAMVEQHLSRKESTTAQGEQPLSQEAALA